MKLNPLFLLLIAFFLMGPVVQLPAQNLAEAEESKQKGDVAKADKFLFSENYSAALEEYLLILEEFPENTKVNYNIGVCYLNSDFDKVRSIPYFQKVLFYDPDAANAYYMMGLAYHYDHQFDRAIDMFNNFKKFYYPGLEYSVEDADKEIEFCENAYQLAKFPVQCTFENLGPSINSEYPDYFPYIPLDESFVVFTSQRNDGSELLKNGEYASNIYISKVVDGNFAPAQQIGGDYNTPDQSETVIGLSGDGKTLLVYEMKNNYSTGDVATANFDESSNIQDLHVLDNNINSKYSEIAASISSDGNTIYFASDRPGGFGGTDIWRSKKLPIGKWGIPENMGASINTDEDEDFPNISPDGKTLYFSSKGHFSMGGFDIYKAAWDSELRVFDNPRNLGYPLNSGQDDVNYRESRSGRYGYISKVLPEGYGDLDIYRVTITEIEPEFTVLKGHIKGAGGKQVDVPSITVTDEVTQDLFGVYAPNPKSMRYIIIVPPGKYEVLIEADGFQSVTNKIDVLGKSSFRSEIDEDIVLKPE